MNPVVAYWYFKSKQLNRQREWVHPLNQVREHEGVVPILYEKLREDEVKFRNYVRMSVDTFDELLSLTHSKLKRKDKNYRRSIDTTTKLLVTLR